MNSQLIDCTSEPQCKYCLEETNFEDMVSPCKCSGSTKYVHKECLRNWFIQRNNRVVIPGNFNQFDTYKCEVCHTKYNCEYINQVTTSNITCDVAKYILCISIFLGCSYVGIGNLMQLSDSTRYLFNYMENNGKWHNILWNGFCTTHLLIGIYYLIKLLLMSNGDSYCCFVNAPLECNDCDCRLLMIIIIGIGILGTVLMIYFDVIPRVIQRHDNKNLTVLEIYDYKTDETSIV
jgi:hypothetical protein